MTAYILSFTLTTSDRTLVLAMREHIQSMANDCDPEDVDLEFSQERYEGVE